MVETEEGQAVTGRRLVNVPDVDTRQLPRPTRLFLSTGQNRENEYLVQKEIAAKAGITTTPHMGSGVSVFQAATLQCAAVAAPEFLQESGRTIGPARRGVGHWLAVSRRGVRASR